MVRVVHKKSLCRKCGACIALSPSCFEFDEEGLAQLKRGKKQGKDWVLENADDSVKQAADVCPECAIDVD